MRRMFVQPRPRCPCPGHQPGGRRNGANYRGVSRIALRVAQGCRDDLAPAGPPWGLEAGDPRRSTRFPRAPRGIGRGALSEGGCPGDRSRRVRTPVEAGSPWRARARTRFESAWMETKAGPPCARLAIKGATRSVGGRRTRSAGRGSSATAGTPAALLQPRAQALGRRQRTTSRFVHSRRNRGDRAPGSDAAGGRDRITMDRGGAVLPARGGSVERGPQRGLPGRRAHPRRRAAAKGGGDRSAASRIVSRCAPSARGDRHHRPRDPGAGPASSRSRTREAGSAAKTP